MGEEQFKGIVDIYLKGTNFENDDYFKLFLYDKFYAIKLLSYNDKNYTISNYKLQDLIHLIMDAYQAGIDDYERWLMDGDEDADY